MKFEIILKELNDTDLLKIESTGTLKIPNVVTTIGAHAFWGLENLITIKIPNSVEKIDAGAFSDCRYLTSVYLPKKLKFLHHRAFSGCEMLDEVYVYESTLAQYPEIKSNFGKNVKFLPIKENEIDSKTK